METYLWIEDREDKSGYTFWKTLMNCLYPHVIVESKKNNIGLIKAVKHLSDDEKQNNFYIIALDESFDNDQVVREIKELNQVIKDNPNIEMLHIISFEYILLSFTKLIEWIYAEEDEFRDKRINEIKTREALLDALENKTDYKNLDEIKNFVNDVDAYNIEQFVSKLLFSLTRNTGFEVAKGTLGECWRVACCDYLARQEDDLCGLDTKMLSLNEKAEELYQYSILKGQFDSLIDKFKIHKMKLGGEE